jgi:hypothetical protein
MARDPLCHEFGGMAHGTVSCVTLTLATGTITPLEQRVSPGQASAECSEGQRKVDLIVGTTRLHIACSFRDQTSYREDIVVHATATDPAYPALHGRTFDLGHSNGFADGIHVIATARQGAIDFSIDFIVDE